MEDIIEKHLTEDDEVWPVLTARILKVEMKTVPERESSCECDRVVDEIGSACSDVLHKYKCAKAI